MSVLRWSLLFTAVVLVLAVGGEYSVATDEQSPRLFEVQLGSCTADLTSPIDRSIHDTPCDVTESGYTTVHQYRVHGINTEWTHTTQSELILHTYKNTVYLHSHEKWGTWHQFPPEESEWYYPGEFTWFDQPLSRSYPHHFTGEGDEGPYRTQMQVRVVRDQGMGTLIYTSYDDTHSWVVNPAEQP